MGLLIDRFPMMKDISIPRPTAIRASWSLEHQVHHLWTCLQETIAEARADSCPDDFAELIAEQKDDLREVIEDYTAIRIALDGAMDNVPVQDIASRLAAMSTGSVS